MRRLARVAAGAVLVLLATPAPAADWDPTITVGEMYANGQHGWDGHGRYWENVDDAQLWEKGFRRQSCMMPMDARTSELPDHQRSGLDTCYGTISTGDESFTADGRTYNVIGFYHHVQTPEVVLEFDRVMDLAPLAGMSFTVGGNTYSVDDRYGFRTRSRTVVWATSDSWTTGANLKVATTSLDAIEATPPDLAVSSPSAAEGEDLAFVVTLAPSSAQEVQVQYGTGGADGAGDAEATATADADFAATSGTLTFAPGQTRKTVRVATLADSDATEGDETVRLTLHSPVNANLPDPAHGTGTIADAPPPLSAEWQDVPDSHRGRGEPFTVRL
ncbi:MAG: hypothetical protein F4Z60_13035, partial [Chloroflexi bacterium]|nr:hypothetical protein [Chloroflexota bacterium]